MKYCPESTDEFTQIFQSLTPQMKKSELGLLWPEHCKTLGVWMQLANILRCYFFFFFRKSNFCQFVYTLDSLSLLILKVSGPLFIRLQCEEREKNSYWKTFSDLPRDSAALSKHRQIDNTFQSIFLLKRELRKCLSSDSKNKLLCLTAPWVSGVLLIEDGLLAQFFFSWKAKVMKYSHETYWCLRHHALTSGSYWTVVVSPVTRPRQLWFQITDFSIMFSAIGLQRAPRHLIVLLKCWRLQGAIEGPSCQIAARETICLCTLIFSSAPPPILERETKVHKSNTKK